MPTSSRVHLPRFTSAEIAAAIGMAYAPTPEQAAVIEAPLQPLLVVAGAGSGKTETMAARVVWLVANGYVQPEEILGLTFTRKAAGELSERIAARLVSLERAGLWAPVPQDGVESFVGTPTISTYHAYAGAIVRDHGLRLGHEPDARLLTEAAAWQLAHEAVLSWDGPMEDIIETAGSVTAAVIDLAGELAEHLAGTDDVMRVLQETINRLETVPRGVTKKRTHPGGSVIDALRKRLLVTPIVSHFQELKASRDVLDFSDQIALAARLAQTFPEIGAAERERFPVVLLDEFQDTSSAQLTLLASLFAGGDGGTCVTAVGDPHQSIYGWRGASATTLAAYRHAFADPAPADHVSLSTSWRNDSSILDAANLVAAPLRADSVVPVASLQARDGAGRGAVHLSRHETTSEECAQLAQWLAGLRRRRPDTTAAVLCRKRSLFLPVIEALEHANLPYEVVGLGGLLLTPEVGDVLAVLHVVQDPTRGDHLMRLLTGPRTRLGAADLDGLGAWARQRSPRPQVPREMTDLAVDAAFEPTLVEAIEDLPPAGWQGPNGETLNDVARERLAGLARVIARLRTLTGLPLADLVGEAERALGLDIEVLARAEYSPASARAHLDAFADVAAQFSAHADRPTLGGFLDWVVAAIDLERGLDRGFVEATPDAIQVMTIHAAKGLEWDAVAVPGLMEGTFPDHKNRASIHNGQWRINPPTGKGWLGGLTVSGLPYPLRGDVDGLPTLRLDNAPDWEHLGEELDDFSQACGAHELVEERRLAYVALTRARHHLWCSSSVWFTGSTPRVTSRFLTELYDAATGGELPGVTVGEWCPMPPADKDVTRPDHADGQILWPQDLSAHRRAAAQAAADDIVGVLAGVAPGGLSYELQTDLEILLNEREQRAERHALSVTLPSHLSTSQLVSLARGRDAFALDLRRPIPSPPATAARRGTRFHAWVEQHYGRAAMVDPDELPGSADEDALFATDFDALRERFLASEWAQRVPAEIETSVETVIESVAIRGRIDAVFREGEDWIVLDWKTGAPPSDEQAKTLRAIQLGAYRLAWARLRDIPLERIRGAFFYASTGETVWPPLPGEEELAALVRMEP